MNPTTAKNAASFVVALLAAALLAACQSAPPRHAMIDDARLGVAKLRQDPDVVRLAPTQLEDAQLALRRAESAQESGSQEPDLRHLAYLALQRVAIANNIAASRLADAKTHQVIAERQQLSSQRALLAARSAEQQAAEARAAAELARAESDDTLRRQIELLQGRETPQGMAISLNDDLFMSGRETLRGRGERLAGRIADVMRQHPERLVLIQGSGPGTGPQASAELSQRRARVLRDALIARGVPPERIDVPGEAELRGYVGTDTWRDESITSEPARASGVDLLFLDAQGHLPPR